jgi:RNA polymerase-binding transcription factor DksA
MDDIRRVLTAASKRLFLIDLLKTLSICATVALGLMVLARIGQKLYPFELPWASVFLGAAAASVVAALIWSALRRAREQEVAREVDERAGLRESISTALCVAPEKTAWSNVVVEQAGERARRVVVRDAIPITPPRVWPAALAAALALAIVWWLPSYDVAGLFAKKEAAQEEQRQIQQVVGEVKASEKKLEELLAQTSVDLDDEDADDEGDEDASPDQPTRADEVRRAAIKKLTKLSDKIKDAQEGEKSARLEALKQSLMRLREPGEGPMTEFARQLSRGNFADAKEQLREMSEQLSAGEMDEEAAKKLQKQLKNLAKQMDALAQSREQLEQKLQEAGLSEEQAKQAAQDPSKMSEMLEQNAPALSSEMMNQLSQMAQAQQNASESMQSMSQAMQQMAQSMSQQSMGQEGAQSMEDLAQQLSQMEIAQGEMEALDSAMSEIQSQMQQMSQGMGECASCGGDCSGECAGGGDGQWGEGDSMTEGKGSGGPGQGYGQSPDERPMDFMLEKKKQKVANQGGPVIGSSLVFGSQVRGESVAQFESAVGQGRAEAAEAIETRRIPREYERAVQHYFGRLEARAKSRRAGEDAGDTDE